MDTTARRESKIPRPGSVKPLAEKIPNVEKKRKGTPVEEDSVPKRHTSRAITTLPPTVQQMTAASTQPSSNSQAARALSQDETFEELQARTGMSVQDVLNKKLSFRKTTPAAQKIAEMTPLLKELRCAGWYLVSQNDRLDMDMKQWKNHCESVERLAQKDREEWNKQQDEIEERMKVIQHSLTEAEKNNQQLQLNIDGAEKIILDKEQCLAYTERKVDDLTSEVDRLRATIADREGKIKDMEDVVRQSQKYSATLQSYNTSLQSDINAEKAKREELQKERYELQSQVAELGGRVKSLEQVLAFEKGQVDKLRNERDTAATDIAVLRLDLDEARQEKERLKSEIERLKLEVDRFKAAGGKSMETLEALNHSNATLEAQLTTQHKLMDAMRSELALAREHKAMAESLSESRGSQISEYKLKVQQLQESLADAERRVYESELIRRKLHNTIQELKGNIRVFCRVRPISQNEIATSDEGSSLALDFPTSGELLGRGLSLMVPSNQSNGPQQQKHNFAFDKVFAPTSTQEQVFEEISELVQSALDGHKVCIFAYGQTGSGKTYTMLGDADNRGIIPRAMGQVFTTSQGLAQQGWKFTMQACMLEIYNEEYKDLLAKKKLPEGKKHQVVHDANGSTSVSDLTLVDVSSPDKVEELLKEAMEKRSVGVTQMNEQSSRSHMVFTLKIDGSNESSQLKVQGVLNLIDLAGSERVKESGATGVRLKEAQNINKSLSALGDVIMALANKADHIPFRNSKLTWLLQPCLGGDAKTLMFVNVSPSRDFAQESLCSLRFAAKVNSCEIGVARRNVKSTN